MKQRRIMAVTALDQQIADLAANTDKKTLAVWAADCAGRVLHLFEDSFPDDPRPRQAIEACQTWVQTGEFRISYVRRTALDAHAAARRAGAYTAARSAARAAGHAMATAHVKTHSIAAAIYAATAVRDSSDPAMAETATFGEREWQYRHLLELRER